MLFPTSGPICLNEGLFGQEIQGAGLSVRFAAEAALIYVNPNSVFPGKS
jgi:hypothetical protein